MKRLVFQPWLGSRGVFFEESSWVHLRQIEEAIHRASTWASFEAALPPGEFEGLITWVMNGGDKVYRTGEEIRFHQPGYPDIADYDDDNVITNSDPFDPADVLGWSDGDYPPWLGWMFDALPSQFIESYGVSVDSFVSGSWIEYPLELADEMTDVLRGHSFEVRVVHEAHWN